MTRKLTNWLESYLHFTRFEGSPENFHRWTALVVLSAAVNRNCWMEGGYYRTFPNLYVLFLGPSGVGKSSSSGIGIELLKATSAQVHIFKDFITPAALITFMQHATVRVEIGDKLEYKTPVLIYASELGTLINPRSGVRELTFLLTEFFNKPGDHEDRTDKRGLVTIKKPNLTCLLCCFPEWVDEEFTAISLRSGFFGRMMVVTEFIRRGPNPTSSLSKTDQELREHLIADLEVINSLYGEMQWDSETQVAWDKWYSDLPRDLTDSDGGIEVRGFTSRKAQFVQRLAMLNSIAQRDSLLVTMKDFNFGLNLVAQCEHNTRNLRVKPIHLQVVEKLKRCILKLQEKKGDVVAIRDISMRVFKTVTKKELEDGLEQLISIGFCELIGRKLKVLDPKAGD